MNQLKKYWMILSRAGSDNLGPIATKRVILVNHVCLFMAFLAIFFTFVWAFQGVFGMAASNVILFFVQMSFVWLNYKRRYNLVAFLIIFFVMTPLFVGMGMMGREGNVQYCFIPMAGFSILLFDIEERRNIALALLYPVVLLIILELKDYKLFPNLIGHPPSFIIWFTYGMNLVTITMLTLYLFRANTNAEIKYQFLLEEHLRTQKSIDEERSRSIFSSKMAALGEMAGGIAHEINNPLTIIDMSTEYLSREMEKQASDPQHLEMVQKIKKMSQRISLIIKSLSAISRTPDKKVPLERVSLQSIVDDTLILCRHRFQSKGVALKVDTEKNNAFVLCRPVEIGQVLLNLLNNAFDAVSESNQGEVEISLLPENKNVSLAISNNGPPIPKDIRRMIFEPYFSTKAIGKGTGLGLSISKRLMEENGGRLYLDETSFKTRFVLELCQA